MILNRAILQQHLSEADAIAVTIKAQKMKCKTYEKMGANRRGALYPMVHFTKDDFIEAQKEHLKFMRKDFVKKNIRLLKLVEGIKV